METEKDDKAAAKVAEKSSEIADLAVRPIASANNEVALEILSRLAQVTLEAELEKDNKAA